MAQPDRGPDADIWVVRTVPKTGEQFAWAQTCPNVKFSGDSVQDQDRQAFRRKLVLLVDSCMKFPTIIQSVQDFVDTTVGAEVQEAKIDGKDHFKEVSSFGRLDEQWMASWLESRCKCSTKDLTCCRMPNVMVVFIHMSSCMCCLHTLGCRSSEFLCMCVVDSCSCLLMLHCVIELCMTGPGECKEL